MKGSRKITQKRASNDIGAMKPTALELIDHLALLLNFCADIPAAPLKNREK